jgi:D-alanyl-D-alanine carboxypeptidase/D-alanyl-D-alanine-endopeptidase (penicillin-binding protein 4)
MMSPFSRHLLPVLLLLLCQPLQAAQLDPLDKLAAMPNASLLLEENGKTVASKQAGRQMIPASTLKLLTGLAALERWGEEHRFETRFYLQDDILWVRGGGDPYLVSEEIDLIVTALQEQGINQLDGISTDATLFDTNLQIDGRSNSNNPYDAPISSLAANFNTVSYKKAANKIISAEPQTPMTALGKSVARRYAKKKSHGRVNLISEENGPRYFAELLAAKLRLAGVAVKNSLSAGQVPHGLKPIYTHKNSHTLSEVVASMMEHSSNFIANSLFLLMAGEKGPLDMQKAQQRMQKWIRKRFNWKEFAVVEGAGLSRENHLSARQLMEVVKAFSPYRELLPKHEDKVMAKTGTLKGVSCYAGFIKRDGDWQPFSLLINQPSEYNFRVRVAEALSTRHRLPTALCGKDC